MDKPDQSPEGALIERALSVFVPKLTAREAARRAGLSEGRWRQIVSGYQSAGRGSYHAVVAPAATLARMARVVGVTAEQLDSVGRSDAAAYLVPDVVERDIGGGWTVRGDAEAAEDPEVLSFAEELLEQALRLARSRHQ
jgi:hypothetical protein